jgi:hypothetical protein
MSANITKTIYTGPAVKLTPPAINLWRVIGNTGMAFFTALAAASAAGFGASSWDVGVWAGLIQGGLAFFGEVLKETNSPDYNSKVFLL